ncbi:MAG: peptidase M28, partial [Winogradskyella sp.]|nr:peptidase M28 [Winogradskyella sp.]
MRKIFLAVIVLSFAFGQAQTDPKIYDIIDAVSEERLRNDVKTLADFGTRNTFSDTISDTRGIGAARRWIKSQFDNI